MLALDLRDIAAVGTDKELTRMRMLRMAARDEGMQRLELMHEAIVEEELKRAIDRRRGRSTPVLPELIEDVVSGDGPVGLDHELKHACTLWRELHAPLSAYLGGALEDLFRATLAQIGGPLCVERQPNMVPKL